MNTADQCKANISWFGKNMTTMVRVIVTLSARVRAVLSTGSLVNWSNVADSYYLRYREDGYLGAKRFADVQII
jgi:hypothetical protein